MWWPVLIRSLMRVWAPRLILFLFIINFGLGVARLLCGLFLSGPLLTAETTPQHLEVVSDSVLPTQLEHMTSDSVQAPLAAIGTERSDWLSCLALPGMVVAGLLLFRAFARRLLGCVASAYLACLRRLRCFEPAPEGCDGENSCVFLH